MVLTDAIKEYLGVLDKLKTPQEQLVAQWDRAVYVWGQAHRGAEETTTAIRDLARINEFFQKKLDDLNYTLEDNVRGLESMKNAVEGYKDALEATEPAMETYSRNLAKIRERWLRATDQGPEAQAQWERIQRQWETGLITERERDEEQTRIDELIRRTEGMPPFARDWIRDTGIADFGDAIDQMAQDQIPALSDAFTQMFMSIIDGTFNAREAVTALAATIAESGTRILVDWAFSRMLEGALGGGSGEATEIAAGVTGGVDARIAALEEKLTAQEQLAQRGPAGIIGQQGMVGPGAGGPVTIQPSVAQVTTPNVQQITAGSVAQSTMTVATATVDMATVTTMTIGTVPTANINVTNANISGVQVPQPVQPTVYAPRQPLPQAIPATFTPSDMTVDRIEEMPSTIQEQTANVVDGVVEAPGSRVNIANGVIEGLQGVLGAVASASGGGQPGWMGMVNTVLGLGSLLVGGYGALTGAMAGGAQPAVPAEPASTPTPGQPIPGQPPIVNPPIEPGPPTGYDLPPQYRIQRGGVIGDPTLPRMPAGRRIGPGEVPAILHRGELVAPLDSGYLPVQVLPGGKATVTTPGGTVVPVDLDLSKLQAFAAGGIVGEGQLSMLTAPDRHAIPQEPRGSDSLGSEAQAPIIFKEGAIQITANKGERLDDTTAQVARNAFREAARETRRHRR
jgi:hypothetical protein